MVLRDPSRTCCVSGYHSISPLPTIVSILIEETGDEVGFKVSGSIEVAVASITDYCC